MIAYGQPWSPAGGGERPCHTPLYHGLHRHQEIVRPRQEPQRKRSGRNCDNGLGVEHDPDYNPNIPECGNPKPWTTPGSGMALMSTGPLAGSRGAIPCPPPTATAAAAASRNPALGGPAPYWLYLGQFRINPVERVQRLHDSIARRRRHPAFACATPSPAWACEFLVTARCGYHTRSSLFITTIARAHARITVLYTDSEGNSCRC